MDSTRRSKASDVQHQRTDRVRSSSKRPNEEHLLASLLELSNNKMDPATTTWALNQISAILPLDNESLQQVLQYSWTLPKDQAAEHLKNLLGDSPRALEFIVSFNSRRRDTAGASTKSSAARQSSPAKPAPRNGRKKKAPLNQLRPPRQPDDVGDTRGAYQKGVEDDYMPGGRVHKPSPGTSPAPRPSAPTPSSALGTSMPNVHTRTASPRPASKVAIPGGTPMHGASATLADLDSALRALELTTNPAHRASAADVAARRCACMGAVHPLLDAAPNCLACGKIVCAKEGLAPCTFCGRPLLAPDQTHAMIRVLTEARGRARMAAHNAAQQRPGGGSGGGGRGPLPPGPPPSVGESAAANAEAHRDKLLGFQAANAARTRVVDEAAAYEAPGQGGAGWGSAEERAARLRRQQAALREIERAARPAYEKRRAVMSVEVVGGKLVKRYATAESEGEDEEEGEMGAGQVDESAGKGEGGKFAKNPLLGKMVRPVWRPEGANGKGPDGALDGGSRQGDKSVTGGGKEGSTADGKGKARSSDAAPTRSRAMWRRVQDDTAEDNEDVILDGGARADGAEEEAPVQDEPEFLVDEPGYG